MLLSVMKNSFVFTYITLLGVSLITIIEALRTNNSEIRHIMNLESSVSLVAGLVYAMFVEATKNMDMQQTITEHELQNITQMRYMDWAITTPLLLFTLLLFLTFNKRSIPLSKLALIIGLNYIMLLSGYLGETRTVSYQVGFITGTTAFLLMLGVIYVEFVGESSRVHNVVFTMFSIIWSLYGVAYYVNGVPKQIMYNVLDAVAKGLFGVFLWLYFTKMIKIA